MGPAMELVVLSAERCSSEEAYGRISRLALPGAASPALRRRASHMNFSLALPARSTSEWWFFTQGLEGSCTRGGELRRQALASSSRPSTRAMVGLAIRMPCRTAQAHMLSPEAGGGFGCRA